MLDCLSVSLFLARVTFPRWHKIGSRALSSSYHSQKSQLLLFFPPVLEDPIENPICNNNKLTELSPTFSDLAPVPQTTFSQLKSDTKHSTEATTADTLACVALATGMKCLSREKIPLAKGNALHDCHAEILAIRAFNRWLVEECKALLLNSSRAEEEEEESGGDRDREGASPWVRRRRRRRSRRDEGDPGEAHDRKDERSDGGNNVVRTDEALLPPFEFRDDVQIHMYCSEAPCGDASMELLAHGMADGGTPWEIKDPSITTPNRCDQSLEVEKSPSAPDPSSSLADEGLLHGRAFFSLVGIVRRKPGRADAPPTLSKSCSDKLAMKQCTGLLSGLTALLVVPTANTYLSSFVLPARAVVDEAVERAFGAEGRMKGATEARMADGSGGEVFRFRPFRVRTTDRRFAWEKSADAVASNLSAVMIAAVAGSGNVLHQEVLINGVLQGRKASDSRGASVLSRRRMWEAVLEVAGKTPLLDLERGLRARDGTYESVKNLPELSARERMKAEVRKNALVGWSRNIGDDQWSLEM